jgi:hypothetical protein
MQRQIGASGANTHTGVQYLILLALCTGCTCGILGGTYCDPDTGGDAGAGPRVLSEPCDEGSCSNGLACVYPSVAQTYTNRVCLPDCPDAGGCPSGTACVGPANGNLACYKTCSSPADCAGRFAFDCVDAGTTGVCLPVACANSRSTDCPAAFHCVAPQYCCPYGAPCPAPEPGVCVP